MSSKFNEEYTSKQRACSIAATQKHLNDRKKKHEELKQEGR